MSELTAWEAITLELLARVRDDLATAQEPEAVQLLQARARALEDALAAYREMMGVGQVLTPLTDDEVRHLSQRAILCLLAERSGGVLVVREAIRRMQEAGVFGTPEHAASAVYAVLHRNRHQFARVSRGVYNLVGKEGGSE